MATTLTVRNVPPALHARLKRRRENGPVMHDSPADVKRKTREGLL